MGFRYSVHPVLIPCFPLIYGEFKETRGGDRNQNQVYFPDSVPRIKFATSSCSLLSTPSFTYTMCPDS